MGRSTEILQPLSRSAFCLMVALLLLSLNGCSSLGVWSWGQTAAELEQEAIARAVDDSTAFHGVGVGADREQAEMEAKRNLASQLLSQVRSERHQERVVAEDTGEAITLRSRHEYRSTADSLARMELRELRWVDFEQGADGRWFVQVKLDNDTARGLIERSQQKLPALTVAENLLSVPETLPGRRLRYALIGRHHTERLGVKDESFYHRDTGQTTLEGLFNEQIRQAVVSMRLLPVVEEDGVHFVLIERESFTPQAGVLLTIAGQKLTTNDSGRTPPIRRQDLDDGTPVTVWGFDPDDEQGDWRHPGSSRHLQLSALRPSNWGAGDPRLYVHSSPAGAIVLAGSTEESSPARTNVRRGDTVSVSLRLERFEQARRSVEVHKETPYAYVSVALDAQRYGHVDLKAPDGGGVVQVRDRRGRIVSESDERIRKEVSVGTYRVEVQGDPEEPEAYETIRDSSLEVSEGRQLEREYREPRKRIWAHYGWLGALRFGRIGGEPTDGFHVPWVNGSREYADLNRIDSVSGMDHEPLGGDLGLGVQYLADTLNLTFRGDISRSRNDFSLEQSGMDEGAVDLTTLSRRVSLGAGFWGSLFEDRVLMSLTANRAFEHTRWDSDSRAEVLVDEARDEWRQLPSSGETNQFSFLDLSISYNRFSADMPGLGLQFSMVVPEDTFEPFVSVGLSAQFGMKRGYTDDIPASVNARRGTHY